MDRRRLLTVLATGAAGLLADACTSEPRATGRSPLQHPQLGAVTSSTLPSGASPTPLTGSSFPSAVPGAPVVLSHAPGPTQEIALTIDDGYDADTVAAYVEFARSTGIPITFSPNGLYRRVWEPHARVLRPLIEAGQVQIGNHTYDHTDLTTVTDAKLREEVERNEEWVEKTFTTTTRPYLRPPYGARDERTDTLCGELGYTKVLLWNASFGDSRLLTPEVLLAQARRYLLPGAVVLGHANHPTVTHLYDQLVELIHQRHLQPVTLDTMFGSHRSTGT